MGMHLVAHQRQRRDVGIVPKPRLDIGRNVAGRVDFAFFGADDRPAAFRSTRDAERSGIAIIHQELALFPEMSVGENLFLGALP